jgi:hypothetical protein
MHALLGNICKITAMIKTQPWTKKMLRIPITVIIEGIALVKMKTVMYPKTKTVLTIA